LTEPKGGNDDKGTTSRRMRVAWLACTFGTNSMPDPQAQVLLCYQQRDLVMAELKRLAADPSISAVILTPHWGDEGAARPRPSDRLYARAAIEAGATAVIGTHPHVLQPWERVTTSDGRDGLVIYSTGNFLSNQHTTAQRSGVISLLELTRLPGETKARMTAAGFVPTWVEKQNDTGHRVVEMTDGGWYVGQPAPGAKVTPPTRRAGRRGPKASTAEAAVVDGLAATLKLLPDNRVAMANFRALPRGNCPPVGAATPPPMATAPEPMPDVMAVAGADTVAETGAVQATTMTAMVTDSGPVPSRTLTFERVAGAISVVVAAFPRLPLPRPQEPPRVRTDPVLRTRRPNRLRDDAGYDLVGTAVAGTDSAGTDVAGTEDAAPQDGAPAPQPAMARAVTARELPGASLPTPNRIDADLSVLSPPPPLWDRTVLPRFLYSTKIDLGSARLGGALLPRTPASSPPPRPSPTSCRRRASRFKGEGGKGGESGGLRSVSVLFDISRPTTAPGKGSETPLQKARPQKPHKARNRGAPGRRR
jgi:hypothetical protein